VPTRIVYDNTQVAVAQILGGKDRRLTRGFLQLKSHYLFDHRFCQVRRANEKGVGEGTVKHARLNFFAPVPSAAMRSRSSSSRRKSGGRRPSNSTAIPICEGAKCRLLTSPNTANCWREVCDERRTLCVTFRPAPAALLVRRLQMVSNRNNLPSPVFLKQDSSILFQASSFDPAKIIPARE
jgi:hypothetical protein